MINIIISLHRVASDGDEEDLQKVKNMDVFSVTRDCELRKFIIEECRQPFERGRAYYQFVRETEDIFDDTDIVIMNKVIDHCNGI